MVRTASQTAAEDRDEPAPARESAPFDFERRKVALYKPTTGQEYILLTVLNLGDESASRMEKVNTVRTFGVMLQSLFVKPADLDYVLGTLARGGEIEPFIDMAKQMAEYWDIEDEAAEDENREERRARERRPAAPRKAAPRRAPAGGPARPKR